MCQQTNVFFLTRAIVKVHRITSYSRIYHRDLHANTPKQRVPQTKLFKNDLKVKSAKLNYFHHYGRLDGFPFQFPLSVIERKQ
jgi:hypothetical protein